VYELNRDWLDGHYPFNQGNVHAALLEVPIHGDRKPKGIEVPTNLRALQPGQLARELSHVGFQWSSIVGAAKKPDGAFLEGWFTHTTLCTLPVTIEKTPFLFALKKASCKIREDNPNLEGCDLFKIRWHGHEFGGCALHKDSNNHRGVGPEFWIQPPPQNDLQQALIHVTTGARITTAHDSQLYLTLTS